MDTITINQSWHRERSETERKGLSKDVRPEGKSDCKVKARPDAVESFIRNDLIRDDPCLHVGREASKDSNSGAAQQATGLLCLHVKPSIEYSSHVDGVGSGNCLSCRVDFLFPSTQLTRVFTALDLETRSQE